MKKMLPFIVLFITFFAMHGAARADLNKDLFKAIEEGTIEDVQRLLADGADIDAKGVLWGSSGATPLTVALAKGKTDIATLLIRKGADVKAKDRLGYTALWFAARNGLLEMASLLLERGAEVNVPAQGQTPLFRAAASGHREMVDFLVSKGADIEVLPSYMKRSPLHKAVILGDDKKVESLIAAGADVNANPKYGATPLHWAARLGPLKLVDLLLKRGADPNAMAGLGTPLTEAARSGRLEIAKMLIAHGARADVRGSDNVSALHRAVKRGNLELVRLLIAHGADVNAAEKNNKYTPLHYAIENGHLDVAKTLLASGADVNLKASRNQTPLSLSVEKGDADAVRLLLGHGADTQAKSYYKIAGGPMTPLDASLWAGNLEIAELLMSKGPLLGKKLGSLLRRTGRWGQTESSQFLIRKGADVNARSKWGRTPLHETAHYGKVEVARLLIAKGADVNARTTKGRETPLYSAVDKDHLEIAKLLIASGADVNSEAQYGKTPLGLAIKLNNTAMAELLIAKGADVNKGELLHIAASRGNAEIVELLIAHGADIKAKNRQGDTPVELADKKGHHDVAGLLRSFGASSKTALVRQRLTSKMKALDEMNRDIERRLWTGGDYSPLPRMVAERQEIIRLAQALTPPPAIPEEARRQMAHGKAAFQAAHRTSDFLEAEEHFEKAANIAPWWAPPYFNLGLVQEKIGDYDYAMANLKLYLYAAPNAPDAAAVQEKIYETEFGKKRAAKAAEHINRAAELYNAGDTHGAIRENKEAIRLVPDWARAHANLGTAYTKLKRYQEAIPELKEAIRLGEDASHVYVSLAMAYRNLDQLKQAISILEEGVREASYDLGRGFLHQKLGRYYEKDGQYEKALKQFESALNYADREKEVDRQYVQDMIKKLKRRLGR